MDLRTFVHRTIADIMSGVDDARREFGVAVAPGVVNGKPVYEARTVDFEIAITSSSDGSGGVKVVAIADVSGSVKQESMNRISFSVPVYFNQMENPNE